MAAYTNTVMVADTTDVEAFMGAGIDAAYTVTMQDLVGTYTESYLCMLTNFDLTTAFASELEENFKLILSEYVARAIAIEGIKYNMKSNFTSRVEAEDMINYHLFRMRAIEKVLKVSESLTSLGVT